jgi:hypothetical protein
MMQVRQVTVITSNPTENDRVGSCEIGYYTIEGDLLTMVDSEGAPLRNANTGERITHRMVPGENEKAIARRLTLRIWREARGDEMSGFNRRIDYGPEGIA